MIQSAWLCQTFWEVDDLLNEMLPQINSIWLRQYLNYVVRDIVRLFAKDYYLICKGKLNPFEHFHEKYSDEKVFRYNVQKMQMPKFKSLFCPKFSAMMKFTASNVCIICSKLKKNSPSFKTRTVFFFLNQALTSVLSVFKFFSYTVLSCKNLMTVNGIVNK